MPLFFAMKHNKILKAIAAIIGFIVIGWASFMQPGWLLIFGMLLGACGYALIFFILTPLGNITLGERHAKLSFGAWFSKLIVLQLVLLIFTIAIAVGFFAAGPEYTLDTVNMTDFKAMIAHYSRWQWGPFPWNSIGIWALVIAYLTYVQQGEPYLYQVGQHYIPKRYEPMLKTYIESSTMGATTMAFSLLVAAIVLLFSYVVEFQIALFHFSFAIMTVVLLSFIGPLASLGAGRKIFRWLAGGRKATLNRALIMMIALLVPTMIASAYIGDYLLTHRPQAQMSILCRQCGNYFANVPQETRLAAFYWGWWLVCTPLAGSYVARISRGRTIREFVIGLYAVPACIAILWGVFTYYPIAVPDIKIAAQQIPLVMLGLALLCTSVLLLSFRATTDTQLFLAGFMQPSATAHPNRLWLKDSSKTVGINKYHPKIFMTIIGSLFLHTMAGWYGMQLQAAAMGTLVMNALYMGFNCGIAQLWRDRKILKSHNSKY